MELELKDAQPCPFGGSNSDDIKIKKTTRGDHFSVRPWYRVECNCGLCGPWAPLVSSAVIEWNEIILKYE